MFSTETRVKLAFTNNFQIFKSLACSYDFPLFQISSYYFAPCYVTQLLCKKLSFILSIQPNQQNCLHMPEYSGIWVNVLKFAWITFVYLNAWLLISTKFLVWMNMRLLDKTKFAFLYSSWKCLIFFCFRLNTLISAISNLQGGKGPWI